MNETTQWLMKQAAELSQAATSYEDKAFFSSLQHFIQAQQARIDQAQGEVDGRSWNHEQW